MLDMLFKRRLKARIINAMFVLNSVQPNVNAQHCIHTPFLGKNKQHAVGSKYRLIVYYYLHWVRIQYMTNIWLTYLQFARPIPRVYMNIFNDAARPHRATWLSPFFVVIEFSKAMWQIDNDFKNRLPGVDTSTSFREAKKRLIFPSCLSDGLVWLLHWLKTEGCAQHLTAPGRCRRRMARNKYTHSIPLVRKRCAEWQRLMCFCAPAANSANPHAK